MVVVIEGLEGGEVFGQTLVRSRDLVWVSVLLLRSTGRSFWLDILSLCSFGTTLLYLGLQSFIQCDFGLSLEGMEGVIDYCICPESSPFGFSG